MLKFLDRLFTREVRCRNCPNFVRVRNATAISDGKELTVRLGVCALMPPVTATYPALAEALIVRYERDWCDSHPLFKPLMVESDADKPPLAFGPGLVKGAGLEDFGGFSRVPSIQEALQFLPKNKGGNNSA